MCKRAGWGKDVARESRLRCALIDLYIQRWNCTKFFSLLISERHRLYETPPIDWVDLGAAKDLCVLTPAILAYTRRMRIAASRGTPALAQERTFLWNVLFCDWSVFALLGLFHVVYQGIDSITRCCDGRLYSCMERPPDTEEILFPLLPRLVNLTRTVGVPDTFRGTAF